MEPWELFTPTWTCGSLPARSPALYRQVLESLDVAHAERYRPRDGSTFCNIYVSDATKACGCEIPHWLYADELSANRMVEWLGKHGRDHGWVPVDADHARTRVNAGFPTVAVWRNPQAGPGHVAMVLPTASDEPLHVAAAGADNGWDVTIGKTFGIHTPAVLYFSHD